MMRLQLSATKLRLSRIFRYLAVLCIFKVCILAMLVLDFPLPFKIGDGRFQMTAKVDRTTVSPTISLDTPVETSSAEDVSARVEDIPQGAAAAKLAAAMKPRQQVNSAEIRAELPVPSTPSERQTAYGGQTAKSSIHDSMPLLIAGAGERSRLDGGWLDMLGLNRLPIPGLGVQTVCAAGLDMPVPQTGAQSGRGVSPFTPAAQSAPVTMPGAPALPPGIASGQGAGGAPLAPRPGALGAPPPTLPTPQGAPSLPAPAVTPNKAPDDPNSKAQELARQQQDMLMLRQQMDQRLKDIQSAEEKMKDMLREAKGVEDKKVRSLIMMYSSMKPKVAAKALESLDERIAVRLLFGMPPKQAGEILTYTEPGKTAKFTEILTRMRLPE